ncbi:MAG: hypothetical protein Q9188_003754 [Gyalolechia gomerana]
MAPRKSSGEHSVERKIIMAPEAQQAVTQWPDANSGGLEGATSDKVPTLDPEQQRSTSALAIEYPDPLAAPPAYGHSPEALVKDYLTALRNHAETILRYKLPQSALTSTPVEYVLTVPAVWSESAQASTRCCAEKAGMGTGSSLHIITEPEAAAMYALDAMDPHNIKIGDTFVLCDAGGGTVDLISYTVSALKPALRITEAAPGSGSFCGSTFLNRIFHKFLEDKLGNDPNWDDDVLEEAMQRFEIIVSQEKCENKKTWFAHYSLQVPGLKDNVMRDVRRGRLRLTGTDVHTIFEPVVKEVVALVDGQIKATKQDVKAVLMVGGFAQSTYLRDRVRQAVANQGIELMQSPSCWTAVVRGALMKGLASTNSSFTAVKISGRAARRSYGLDIRHDFDESTDDVERRYWLAFKGYYCINRMVWFIKKGDIVEENTPKRLHYVQYHGADKAPPSSIRLPIYTCTDNQGSSPPTYHDARVHHLATVSADLSRIPPHKFSKTLGADGLNYFLITFCIEITYYSGYTAYELIYDGVNYGSVAAEYV